MSDNIFNLINSFRNEVPVDINSLVQALSIELCEADLGNDISGQIERCGDDDYRITVNSKHAETRKRFTVAHELGHYVYHRPAIGDGLTEDRLYRSTDLGKYHNTAMTPFDEKEANNFAAYLLMPDHMIRKLLTTGFSPEDLAGMFKVSSQAMRIKLGAMNISR